tara:strand:- start:324 stop:1331 length:1008 start_codon:yes stop_codon:yes gene_type:complete
MSAFKQLLASDVIVSPFEVNKSFNFSDTEFDDTNVQISRFEGIKSDFFLNKTTTGTGSVAIEYKSLMYDSIKELYYTNYLGNPLGSPAGTSSILLGSEPSGNVLEGALKTTNYYNYISTDLIIPRFIPTGSGDTIGIISIPSRLWGDYIQPKSVKITSASVVLRDDGEGTLYIDGVEPQVNYGNVIYEHGIITLTNSASYCRGGNGGSVILEGYGYSQYGDDVYGQGGGSIISPALGSLISGSITVAFSSSYQILESQYKTTIRENEFNFSLNPSLISGSEGEVYNFATSSYFSPYVTTIGLYNNNQDLLAIGKLSQPLPTSRTTDTNIFINIDR